MRHLAAGLALVSLCACAGSYSSGGTDLLPPDSGGGAGTDGGSTDAGSDGGVDGGPDAGCVQRTLNVGAIDNCQGDAGTTASVYVSDPAQGCTVSITINTASTPCTGVASHGTLDAFDGGCAGSYVCTSPSLPGTLTCNNGFNTCYIRICDAGVCGP